jgi:hypothetical protein
MAPAEIEAATSQPEPPQAPVLSKIVQFDWSRHWMKKVEPYLDLPLVRLSVEMGMRLHDRNWSWEDGPHSIGRGSLNGQRVIKNKLSWYQPWGRCHWISFFACAIGVLNYPELDWQFLSGKCHTIPVGSRGGEYRVVMDILNFKQMTAEASIAHASIADHDRDPNWERVFALYLENIVPALRKQAMTDDGPDQDEIVLRERKAG